MGLAVPHARVQGINRPGIYAAYTRSGFAWSGEEVHIITLLIVPLENPEMHLRLLSRVVRWRRGLTEAEMLALCESSDRLSDSLQLAAAGDQAPTGICAWVQKGAARADKATDTALPPFRKPARPVAAGNKRASSEIHALSPDLPHVSSITLR